MADDEGTSLSGRGHMQAMTARHEVGSAGSIDQYVTGA